MLARDLTSQFPEVQELIEEKTELTRKLRRIRRKLHSINSQHEFLTNITSELTGIPLEKEIAKLLIATGFKSVSHTGERSNREDVYLVFAGTAYLIECRGRKNGDFNNNDIGQMTTRLSISNGIDQIKRMPKKVITVFNHEFAKPIEKREPKPCNYDIEKTLEHNRYSMVTTVELVRGFIMVKKGELEKEQFLRDLSIPGIVRFKDKKERGL